MAEKEFEILLDSNVRLRVRIRTRSGAIVEFVVQIEIEFDGQYRPVVRYDLAHGFPHRDLLRPDGTIKRKTAIDLRHHEALNFALNDTKENWVRYVQDFQEEGRRRGEL